MPGSELSTNFLIVAPNVIVYQRLEKDFASGKHTDDPNVLTCTSTLEMGIDIGDLSSTMLCSIPPTTASYLQRIGRAGRATGTALIVSIESAGGRLDELDGPYDLRAAPGMTATTWRLARRDPQRALRCDLAVLTDDRYEYAVVLESRSAEAQARHRAALHDLVASITPLAVAAPAATADVFAHWTC